MAKQYPRFLFSNPQNTKSKGAFVIHTSEPHIIIGVYGNVMDGSKFEWSKFIEPKPQFMYLIALLTKRPTKFEEAKKFYETLDDMVEWLRFQIKNDHITIK
jgi:hypothetical protein